MSVPDVLGPAQDPTPTSSVDPLIAEIDACTLTDQMKAKLEEF